MTENDISYKIRGAIFNVYNNLGPGLLESAYETALKIELEKEGLLVENQVYLPIVYGGVQFDAIAKALLLPGMPIKSLYVGLNVSTLNSQDAFSTPSVERA